MAVNGDVNGGVERVLGVGAMLGEGPLWFDDALWFVDIKQHRVQIGRASCRERV